jgi:hypothetical protein
MLLALLDELGHDCHAVDFADQSAAYPQVYGARGISFHVCNVEIDALPFADGVFDSVVRCQVPEHYLYAKPVLDRGYSLYRCAITANSPATNW